MSYKINTTNGTLLVDLIDGRIDTASTDLVLIGRNYTGYGEAVNENFVKVLENFANTAPPPSPLTGQLWYDTGELRLKIFNGTSFNATTATVVSATAPVSMAAGELWVDLANKQLKFSDGETIMLAGPAYTSSQGQSGLDIQTLIDEFGNPKVIARLMISAQPVAIISRETFNTSTPITNFDTQIKEGINISSLYNDFLFHGTAESALTLSGIPSTGFLQTNPPSNIIGSTTTGILKIQTDLGLTVGDNSDLNLLISGNDTIIRNQTSNAGIKFQVNTGSTSSPSLIDYLTVNTNTGNMGIWQDNPQYNLDITGNTGILGDVNIVGDTVITGTLVVADIELDSSTISTTTDPLTIVSAGAITVNDQRITGIADPTSPQDAASKQYVDELIDASNQDVFFSLDITGVTNPEISEIIESMVPASTKAEATDALIHCTTYSGSGTYDASDEITKSFITVDKNGTENQSVLADVSFSTANVLLTVIRSLKRFRVVSGIWTYIEDVS